MKQTTNHILLVKPLCFQFNVQTKETNAFQVQSVENKQELFENAIHEFEQVAEILQQKGVSVNVIDDTLHPEKPDAIFPNNWVSFHERGEVILYPMMAENRRLEKRIDILEKLKQSYQISKIIDLSYFEEENKFLEGTGSIILDRKYQKAYACLSPRTNKDVLYKFCETIKYSPIFFYALDENKKEIYHTNVMMCLGIHFAVVCLSSIHDEQDKKNLIYELKKSGREIIDIDIHQVKNFAGNMIELIDGEGNPIIVLSQTAMKSLHAQQISSLQKHGQLVPVNVNTIEMVGGGSIRCMIAEIFLPLKHV